MEVFSFWNQYALFILYFPNYTILLCFSLSHTHTHTLLLFALTAGPTRSLWTSAQASTRAEHWGEWGCTERIRMTRTTLASQDHGALTFVASKISSKSIGRFLFCNHKAWLMSMKWVMGQWCETVNQAGPSCAYRGGCGKPLVKIFKRTAVLKA